MPFYETRPTWPHTPRLESDQSVSVSEIFVLCHDHSPCMCRCYRVRHQPLYVWLTANIWLTVSPKIIPIDTSEIPRNILYVNTVLGVVGAIRIATTSSFTAATSSTATASVASITFPTSTTTTCSYSLPSTNFLESTFIFIFYLCIWKYIGGMNEQVGHCIEQYVHAYSRKCAYKHPIPNY